MTRTVLYLVDSLGLSGKTLGLVNLALRLDPARYRAVVGSLIAPEGALADRLRAGGVSVHHVPCEDGVNADVVRRMLALEHDLAPDLVHAYNLRPMLYGGLAARLRACPAIGSLSAFACMGHERTYTFLPQPLQTRRSRHRVRNRVIGAMMRRLIAVSRRAGDAFCGANRIPRRKLRVIGYGVDLEAFDRVPPADTARLRAELGVRPGEVVIGTVGRLVEQKDYPNLLRAFAMASQLARMRLVVAGAGPLAAELQALARDLGIAGYVSWLGERRDVPRILRSLDVFALASKFEPFGVALLEAMAAGLPIVATRVNEVPEILDGGDTGVLVTAEQPAELARALVTIAADPALRDRLGGRAREVAVARHGLGAVVDAHQALYDEVVNR